MIKKTNFILLVSLLFFPISVYASSSEFSVCSNSGVLSVLKLLGVLILISKIVLPVLLIVVGIIDLGKATIISDHHEVAKATKDFLQKFFIGVIVFFVPTILDSMLNYVSSYNELMSSDYKSCSVCWDVKMTNFGACEEAIDSAKEKEEEQRKKETEEYNDSLSNRDNQESTPSFHYNTGSKKVGNAKLESGVSEDKNYKSVPYKDLSDYEKKILKCIITHEQARGADTASDGAYVQAQALRDYFVYGGKSNISFSDYGIMYKGAQTFYASDMCNYGVSKGAEEAFKAIFDDGKYAVKHVLNTSVCGSISANPYFGQSIVYLPGSSPSWFGYNDGLF